ncbi:phosphoribosylglycinamide formyltransferase [Patescibacteria group bacterium]|nr:phosphoribosylglycinamide formyltransferase [Patescibacteria group bacterium]
MVNLAVLASGTGSLFAAMLEQKLPIRLMVTDRPCRALEIADEAGLPHVLLPRRFGKGFDRDAYTREMLALFREHHIGLVAMAGFMTVFTPRMFAEDAYRLKILNTHPSLLPSFKGDHAVKDAIVYGVKTSGCTIHWTTEELDAGPIIAQESVKVLPSDTVESLHERIKEVERQLYPALLKTLI